MSPLIWHCLQNWRKGKREREGGRSREEAVKEGKNEVLKSWTPFFFLNLKHHPQTIIPTYLFLLLNLTSVLYHLSPPIFPKNQNCKYLLIHFQMGCMSCFEKLMIQELEVQSNLEELWRWRMEAGIEVLGVKFVVFKSSKVRKGCPNHF